MRLGSPLRQAPLRQRRLASRLQPVADAGSRVERFASTAHSKRVRTNDDSDLAAMPGDHDFLARLDAVQQLGESCPGLTC